MIPTGLNRIPNRPNHQQVGYFHLSLSVFLLFLTVYPHLFNTNNICCSVSAYSADDIDLKHQLISNFDIIQASDISWTRTIYTRSTHLIDSPPSSSSTNDQTHHDAYDDDEKTIINNELNAKHNNNNAILDNTNSLKQKKLQPRELYFTSLGRRFELVLDKPSHLTTNDFSVFTVDADGKYTQVPHSQFQNQVMDGYVKGEKDSQATCSFSQDDTHLMTAQIKTGQDLIIVEPTYLHRDNLRFSNYEQDSPTNSTSDNNADTPLLNNKFLQDTMIVYNLSDHKEFKPDSNGKQAFDPDKLCPSVEVDSKEFTDASKYNKKRVINTAYIDHEDIFKFYKKPKKFPASDVSANFKKFAKKNKRSIEFFESRSLQSRKKTRCTLHLVADYLFYKHVGNGDKQTTINYLLALINRVNQIYLPTVWETGSEDINDEFVTNIGFTVKNITIHQDFTRLSSGDAHYNMNTSRVWNAREYLDNFSKYSPPNHYCLAHLLTYRQFDAQVLGLAYVASTRYGTIGGICSPTQKKEDFYFKHNTGISTSKGISGETLITRQADLVVAHELGHNLGAEHDSSECRLPPSKGGAFLMHPFSVMGFERNNRFLSNCSRASIGRVIRRKGPECFISVIDHVCGNGIVEDDEECDGGDIGHNHNDPCCDSSCRLTPGSQCSDRHSWCCSTCHIKPAGSFCKSAEEFNCKQASYCDGRSAECPAAPSVEDDKICVGRGLCRSGDCVPFCEAKNLISCLCNTPANACKLCCKASINGTCSPYDNRAAYLDDGLLCYRGVCEKGRCEQPIQDAVERLWDVLEDINFTTFVKFLRDNIIFVVLVASIPIWCIFSHIINEFDKKIRAEVMNAIAAQTRRRKKPLPESAFLPVLFVGDERSNSNQSGEADTSAHSQSFLPQRPDVIQSNF